MFFDAHVHRPASESGGFLIGLQGDPVYDGTITNEEVLSLAAKSGRHIPFLYLQRMALQGQLPCTDFLKYHPRREKYGPEEIISSIRRFKPRCVIIDSLNEPFWCPYDYWRVLRECPDVQFVLAHAGGYQVNEFLKICHFQNWVAD